MMKTKYYEAFTFEEKRLALLSLYHLRNQLIAAGKYTDAVDELIVKCEKARLKTFKVKEEQK